MRIFTLGFTHKSAEDFFGRLRKAGVKRVLDVRLNNISQLAGFSKRDDLAYFLRRILGAGYEHATSLAPTQAMLDNYKKRDGGWEEYREQFLELMQARRIEEHFTSATLDDACLLCSEDKPHFCHRRLVAEYLQTKWPKVTIEHL
jgi:uncharacterized protein (DUF488 family)